MIPIVLDHFKLEMEQPLFKLAMMSNSIVAMERVLGEIGEPCYDSESINQAMAQSRQKPYACEGFGNYAKLAHIAMVHVLGPVEDEWTFLLLTFLKSRLRNQLDSNLELVVAIHGQQVYILQTFPYNNYFKHYNIS